MKRRAVQLSPGTGKPEQIATVLEHEIRSGVLGFGDRLQSENELVQRFSVSRNTVRKGLEELSSRGLITTKVGIGSFVTFDGKPVDDAIGWSRALADAGANAETRTLRLEVIEDTDLASLLGIKSPFFIAVDRVRTNASDGHAISIERSRLPLSPELEDVPLRGLREGSLHQTLRAAGLIPDHGEEWVEIEMLNAEDATILGCPQGTPFLRGRRLTRAVDDRPIEYVTSLLNPAHFALHMRF
ncbi:MULTISPECIES: GntR family transcriptional regulator [unclassified Mesorhizobium]|uniref:GntR family transcriptional regulator n=1 Tax=unclassified Mesorhizobium TaxID=325217 RepID=UPI0003CF1D25|nr:GntR family transcriptional regulator [Mesorhizobium sp. LNHC252B00]ESY70079.1 GntR family transcriptional regulator [Mesorhizobium sp. LNHC252B00]